MRMHLYRRRWSSVRLWGNYFLLQSISDVGSWTVLILREIRDTAEGDHS